MEVIIRSNEAEAARLTARIIANAIEVKRDLVLGLATGGTMVSVYAELVRMHKDDGLDFSLCRTFNLDEYVGIPADNPNSYRSFMNHNLFQHINIKNQNTFLPDGMASDLREESLIYEDKIRECGGIDLQILGMGESGHIGFNEPLSALFSRTRGKALGTVTKKQNAVYFGSEDDVPCRAITMGVGTILDARRIVMLVTGKRKAEILAKAVEGPVTAMISATALQLHPCTTVIVDEAAAEKLLQKEYYRWLFENEPEWELYR